MKELTEDLNKSEQITFPVTYELKVIMDSTATEDESREHIERILNNFKIPFESLGKRDSTGGNYISFTYKVTIPDYPVLRGLYEQLRSMPGIKFAV